MKANAHAAGSIGSAGRRPQIAVRRPRSRGPQRSEVSATKQGLSRKQTAAYQGAFEAVLAIPIAMGIGYWCDGQFDSRPIGLGIGALVGFGAMLLRITRMRPSEDPDREFDHPPAQHDQAQDRADDRDQARDDQSP